MSVVSSEKKKEYNKKYREKKKKEKKEKEVVEETPKVEPEKVEIATEVPKVDVPEVPEEPEEQFTIDRETMEYLMECVQKDNKKVVKEESPQTETKPTVTTQNDTGFFFLMKQAVLQQMAVTVPLIALKLIVDGAKSSIPLNLQRIISQSPNSVTTPSQSPDVRVVNLE